MYITILIRKIDSSTIQKKLFQISTARAGLGKVVKQITILLYKLQQTTTIQLKFTYGYIAQMYLKI